MANGSLFSLDGLVVTENLGDAVQHGEVFTRRWVVETILDLVGYTDDRDLAGLLLVEPACGSGAFLGPIARRLSASCRRYDRPLADAACAVVALDLLDRNVAASRELVAREFAADGWDASESEKVALSWVRQGDYLLRDQAEEAADFVVGNPPYIRLEDVPEARMSAYRAACPTMGGRADIYVGFYEVGLGSLKPGGRLGFICADRWMRNQYGSALRGMVSRQFSVDTVISMHDVDAFDEQVSAYPAITVISRAPQGQAVAADTTRDFGALEAGELAGWAGKGDGSQAAGRGYTAARLPHWFPGDEFWPTASPARLGMLEYLNDRFPLLEDKATGTRVGIGVATGADGVFIAGGDDVPDIEPDRLLPLVMVRDTTTGVLNWHGGRLVSPWGPDGGLVDLRDYPRLARYFEANGDSLRKRHVAQRATWYRTIDKVDQSLTARPKLLLPDMKLTIHPVFEPGGLYPHHNLYYVVSDTWDLQVLGGLLLSKVAEAFVAAYAVRMRGGTLRFQAQYLRKIRVPRFSELREDTRAALAEAFGRRDVDAATKAALNAYGLSEIPN